MRERVSCLSAVLVLVTSAARADPPIATPSSTPPPIDVPSIAPAPPMPTIAFDEALRRGATRNPSIILADEEIRRAHALMEQVRSLSLPTLTGNAAFTRLDSDRVLNGATGPTVISPANQLNVNALVVVPLVEPQHWAQWSHADEAISVAHASAQDVRRTIATLVARTYLALVAQHRIVGSYLRAAQNARAHAEFAHTRWAGGIGNRLDEVRAAQEFASDQAFLSTQLTILAREQEALGVLLGEEGPLDSHEEPAIAPTPDVDAALRGVDTRADVRLSNARLRAARHLVRDNYTDYLPTLLATFQPFIQDPPTLTQPQTGWQAQLILSVPLYDGGLRYGLAHERESLASEARESLDATLRQARSEVRTAFIELQRAQEAALAAHEAERLADEGLALANLAYREGANTNIDVIDAERRARDASAAAALADDNVRQARLDLLLAAGRFP